MLVIGVRAESTHREVSGDYRFWSILYFTSVSMRAREFCLSPAPARNNETSKCRPVLAAARRCIMSLYDLCLRAQLL